MNAFVDGMTRLWRPVGRVIGEVVFAAKVITPVFFVEEKKQFHLQRAELHTAKRKNIAANQAIHTGGWFQARKAVLCVILVVLAWACVFTIGKSLSSGPYRLFLNVLSVEVVSPERELALRNGTPPEVVPPWLPGAAPGQENKLAPLVTLATAKKPPESDGTTKRDSATDDSEPNLGSLSADRFSAFFKLYGIESPHLMLLVALGLAVLSYTYSNMLILATLSATVGAMLNYAFQAVRASRHQALVTPGSESGEEPAAMVPLGHRRVFASLGATVVVGIGFGFAAFVVCASGLIVFPGILDVGSAVGYQQAVFIASLLGFIAAVLPDRALAIIERRIQDAESAGRANVHPGGVARPADEASRPPSGSGQPGTFTEAKPDAFVDVGVIRDRVMGISTELASIRKRLDRLDGGE